ncbi:hypothetical protein DFA_06139 [Cavenderia fasciculata]|uniref:Uncharacterized protein n=1 Tax=Cavenderia fasciculata TaxID=261658 RepID=F4PK77_CACFS|nr:uncharacterized protein DFA_06139 [Cavenderia fasciculata]EGG24001.1 hypothetical protein DFA_06139 [Cavenderia fasciculata]|eukprot:XP_004361852.1 hypothetical protein DFA_06139 [Cavenderia fasciculata]
MDIVYLFVTVPEYRYQQRQQQIQEQQQQQQLLLLQQQQQQQDEQEQCCESIEIETSFLPSTPTTLYSTELDFDMDHPNQLPQPIHHHHHDQDHLLHQSTSSSSSSEEITQEPILSKDCMMLDHHSSSMYSYSHPSIISNATPTPPLESYSVPFVDNDSYPIVF